MLCRISLFLLFCAPLSVYASQIDYKFDWEGSVNFQLALVHDKNLTHKISQKFITKTLDFKNQLNIKVIPIDVGINLSTKYEVKKSENISFGINFKLDELLVNNNQITKFSNNDNLYIFLKHKKFGTLQFGYANAVEQTFINGIKSAKIGGNGIAGNWLNYTYFSYAENPTYPIEYNNDSNFWFKESAFSEYFDFKMPKINYISPQMKNFQFGFTYAPGVSKNFHYLLNDNYEIKDILYLRNLFGVAIKYTLEAKFLKITFAIGGEKADIINIKNKFISSENAILGNVSIDLNNFQFIVNFGIPQLLEDSTNDYLSAGAFYTNPDQKIGISAFFSQRKSNNLSAIAIDFEKNIDFSFFVNKNRKISSKNYIKDCAYYVEIVGFETERKMQVLQKNKSNVGYLLILGLKALF